MRPCAGRADGSIEVLDGVRAAARSGSVLRALDPADVLPLPEGSTLMRLPGRTATVLREDASPLELGKEFLPLAAVLPVGHLRTLLPASRLRPGSERLPLYGYAAVAIAAGSWPPPWPPTASPGGRRRSTAAAMWRPRLRRRGLRSPATA
jgi:hypothetical protein